MKHKCLGCDGVFERFRCGPYTCPICQTNFYSYDDDEEDLGSWYMTIYTWKGWWKRKKKVLLRWFDETLGIK
jgi:hypothetical protein